MTCELHDYPKPLVPRDIAIQIRSYTRIQWPYLEQRIGDRLWDVPTDFPARNFVLLDGEKLVSHAEANFRPVEHAGETFNVGGLSAVFTFPGYRGKGHATEIVRAATEYLDCNGADLSMLFCGEPLRRFYGSCGWEPIDGAHIICGERAAPTRHESGIAMMRFSSEKGRTAKLRFTGEPVYVGERTW
jgi:GNAT superfamily N-acetyltransferase